MLQASVPAANQWLTNSCQSADGIRPGRDFRRGTFSDFPLRPSSTRSSRCSPPSPWRSRWWRSSSPRRHAALTDEFGASFDGAQNVERVNALIYAVVMESRGIYMSPDPDGREVRSRPSDRQQRPHRRGRHRMAMGGQARGRGRPFETFAERIKEFQEFRRELVRRGIEIDPAAGARMGRQRRQSRRAALNKRPRRAGPGSMPSAPSSSMPRSTRGMRESAWTAGGARGVRGCCSPSSAR